MKTKKSLFLVVALLLVVGITSYFVAGTYAKYTSTVEGTASATVAKWNFATDNATTTFNVNLAENYDASTLKSGRIAPGTSGSFSIALTNTSEVGVDFTIALGTVTNKPTNLKFYSDSAKTTELTPGSGTITGHLAEGSTTTQTTTQTIYWAWIYETANGDSADTTDGTAGASLTFPVTITGVQTTPSTTGITTTTSN